MLPTVGWEGQRAVMGQGRSSPSPLTPLPPLQPSHHPCPAVQLLSSPILHPPFPATRCLYPPDHASPCPSQPQLSALLRCPQGGCPGWCQAAGTLGIWVATLAAQPALGALAVRGSLVGVQPAAGSEGQTPLPAAAGRGAGQQRVKQRLAAGRGPGGGGRWRSLFNSWRQAMQLCRSDGPCSPRPPPPPPRPCPGRQAAGRKAMQAAGRRAGRLARGWQLGSLSRVIKSRNASPRAGHGRRCLPARQGTAAAPGR